MNAELISPPAFDWKHPDYLSIAQQRLERLNWIRKDPGGRLPALRKYYAAHTADFINDWGMTFDPRNAEVHLPTTFPFLLWPRQREYLDWLDDRWHSREPGLVEKTRDCGASWLSLAWSCSKCLFIDGMVIGFGSRKEEYVDKLGSPKALFVKARLFLSGLPREFLPQWGLQDCCPHMRLLFPFTKSAITGESGDGIGRGDRTSVYFVDESAFLERPELTEHSLSQTTNCRIDVSTPNGSANPFAQKVASGKYKVFIFDWRHDPRKGEAWYENFKATHDEITVAQEVDRNYHASTTGIVIPQAWAQAAVGAAEKLGIRLTGNKRAALDVADEGSDYNSLAGRDGVELVHLESWSGKGSDIFATTTKAFGICDDLKAEAMYYDADGLGAGVRGDANQINTARAEQGARQTLCEAFRGSAAVVDPTGEMVPERKNEDYFLNLKAQSYWALRLRFEKTWRWVVKGIPTDPDEIISLAPGLPELPQLLSELSQPQWKKNLVGKILIDKAPDGAKSPNRADAVMMLYSPLEVTMETWAKLGAT